MTRGTGARLRASEAGGCPYLSVRPTGAPAVLSLWWPGSTRRARRLTCASTCSTNGHGQRLEPNWASTVWAAPGGSAAGTRGRCSRGYAMPVQPGAGGSLQARLVSAAPQQHIGARTHTYAAPAAGRSLLTHQQQGAVCSHTGSRSSL